MASRSYKIGQRFEYRVRDYLRKLGYVVVRSPRSSGPFDLIAAGFGSLLLVQCKVNGVCRPTEWNSLLDVACSVQGIVTRAVVVSRVKRKLEWRQILAPKNHLRGPQPWVQISIHATSDASRTLRAA